MTNKQDFLRRYMSWCLSQAGEELEAGMPNLSWVGHLPLGFFPEYLRQKPIAEAIELFSALQHRRWLHQGVEWEADQRIRHEAMLEDFMHAGREYNNRHVEEYCNALELGRLKVANSATVKQMAWKSLRSKGWRKIPWNPGIIKCAKETRSFTLNTYVSSEVKEFTYYQQVVSGAGESILETSFADWFGLGQYTMFSENELGSEERISEFVVEKCELFASALPTLLGPDSE